MEAKTFSGNPCTSCGSATRYKSNTRCVLCVKNHDSTSEAKLAKQKYRKTEKFRTTHRQYSQSNQRRFRYGLSEAVFTEMLVSQNSSCAICHIVLDSTSKNLTPHLDHDHSNECIRGLLCGSCNLLLGHAKDNPATLKSAVTYLETQKWSTY